MGENKWTPVLADFLLFYFSIMRNPPASCRVFFHLISKITYIDAMCAELLIAFDSSVACPSVLFHLLSLL